MSIVDILKKRLWRIKSKLSYMRLSQWTDVKRDLAVTKKSIGNKSLIPDQDFSRYMLIMSFSNLPFLIKAHSLIGMLMKQKGFEPILLTYSGCRWARPYAEVFGVKTIIYWDGLGVEIPSEQLLEIEKIVDKFLSTDPDVQDLKNWQYSGVNCGKHAMSTMIRKELKGQLNPKDKDVRKVLRNYLVMAVGSVIKAESIFNQYPIEKVLVRDSGYLPNGAIFETALNRGIDSIRFEMAQMKGYWQVKRYTKSTKGQALFSISPDTWNLVKSKPLTKNQIKELDLDFEERYNPVSSKDMYNYQRGKSKVDPDEVRKFLSLDQRKPTAVIFSHISWDANFFDGEDLFDDFESWLVETVKIACSNKNLNWVVKLHPANVFKLVQSTGTEIRETELEALEKLGKLPAHIKILRSGCTMNTWSLINVMDVGLTVRGTIGMELPCFGIPVVIAGTGRYNGYGFTIEPKTKEQYKECMLNLHHRLNMKQETIDLAKRHAYWVFLKRTISFNDVCEMFTNVSENPTHPLHHNLIFHKNFSENLSNSKTILTFLSWLTEGNTADFIAK